MCCSAPVNHWLLVISLISFNFFKFKHRLNVLRLLPPSVHHRTWAEAKLLYRHKWSHWLLYDWVGGVKDTVCPYRAALTPPRSASHRAVTYPPACSAAISLRVSSEYKPIGELYCLLWAGLDAAAALLLCEPESASSGPQGALQADGRPLTWTDWGFGWRREGQGRRQGGGGAENLGNNNQYVIKMFNRQLNLMLPFQ